MSTLTIPTYKSLYKDNLPYRSRLDGRSKDILDYVHGLLGAHSLRARPSDIIRRALTFYIDHIDNLVEGTNRDGTLLGDLAFELHLLRKTRGVSDSPWKDIHERPDFSTAPLKPFREYVREQEQKNAQRLLESFKGDPSDPSRIMGPPPSQRDLHLKEHKVLAKSILKGTLKAAEQLKIK
jgi:hypothetical protein